MKTKFEIIGLDCPVCASKLATRVAELEGVTRCKINFLTEEMTVESDAPVEEAAVLGAVKAFDKKLICARK